MTAEHGTEHGRGAGDTYCPSAAPDVSGATILGVTTRTDEGHHVVYLADPVPFTEEIAATLGDISDGEVLRTAAPCQESSCSHFRDSQCSLITKIVRAAPEVPAGTPLPRCYLRPRCRWFRQEKAAACHRCDSVVTVNNDCSDLALWIADPANSAEEFDPREFQDASQSQAAELPSRVHACRERGSEARGHASPGEKEEFNGARRNQGHPRKR